MYRGVLAGRVATVVATYGIRGTSGAAGRVVRCAVPWRSGAASRGGWKGSAG